MERIAGLIQGNHLKSAQEIVQVIFEKAMSWSAGKYTDDMTALVLKMKYLSKTLFHSFL